LKINFYFLKYLSLRTGFDIPRVSIHLHERIRLKFSFLYDDSDRFDVNVKLLNRHTWWYTYLDKISTTRKAFQYILGKKILTQEGTNMEGM